MTYTTILIVKPMKILLFPHFSRISHNIVIACKSCFCFLFSDTASPSADILGGRGSIQPSLDLLSSLSPEFRLLLDSFTAKKRHPHWCIICILTYLWCTDALISDFCYMLSLSYILNTTMYPCFVFSCFSCVASFCDSVDTLLFFYSC